MSVLCVCVLCNWSAYIHARACTRTCTGQKKRTEFLFFLAEAGFEPGLSASRGTRTTAQLGAAGSLVRRHQSRFCFLGVFIVQVPESHACMHARAQKHKNTKHNFGRSQRVKKLAFELAEALNLSSDWRLELAATFSYLGYLTLPDEVQEKLYNNEDLPSEVMDVVKVFPNFANEIVKGIPRLEDIIPIIFLIEKDYEKLEDDGDDSAKLASVIRLAQHYDRHASDGYSRSDIFNLLAEGSGIYMPGALDALRKIREYSNACPEVEEVSIDHLKPGMRILVDLRLPNGSLVAPKGSVVDAHFIKIIENYVISYFGNPFPERIKVIMG